MGYAKVGEHVAIGHNAQLEVRGKAIECIVMSWCV